jgi:chemotaxis protein MotB
MQARSIPISREWTVAVGGCLATDANVLRKDASKMRVSRMIVMGLALASLALTGCNNKTKTAGMNEEIANLQTQLDDRNRALEDCSEELRARDAQLAELRRNTPTGAPNGNTTGADGWSTGAGESWVTLSSDMAFDSGKATLKSSAKKTLDTIAQQLNTTYSGSNVRVAGHTDTDPIKKSGFKSNYHLAFERAWAVREYLISKGVSSNRLSLASFGPDIPKGSKPQSRRVEIVVVNGGATTTASAAGQ